MKHQLSKMLIFIVLAAIFPSSYSESTSQVAKLIGSTIDAHKQQTINLLETITNIDSQTENFVGVKTVGSYFAHELQALGFKTYWQEMPKDINRAGNLFAIKKGHKGKRILLIGHLDTVFPVSSQARFEYIHDNWVKGIGVSDMKGGDIVMLQALQALHALNLLQDTTIAIALMGDEENPAHPISVSRSELIRLAKESDVVLDFESGPPSVGRRGVTTWKLTTTGTQQHSSLIFQSHVGNGAVYELARILNEFANKFANVENLTINPAVISGGTTIKYDDTSQTAITSGKFNIVAKSSYAVGDLRYLSNAQKSATKKTMRHIVRENYPRTGARITFADLVDPMPPTRGSIELLKELQNIQHYFSKTELVALPAKLRGGGDISFIARYVPAGLVGLGPIGKYEHSLNEMVDLDSIQLASKRVAMLIYKLTETDSTR